MQMLTKMFQCHKEVLIVVAAVIVLAAQAEAQRPNATASEADVRKVGDRGASESSVRAIEARCMAAGERLKKDNPDIGTFPSPTISHDEISWKIGGRPKLTDISAFQGLPLTTLQLDDSRVVDLTPLKGMPLRNLSLARTPVVDLTPLKGMPLRNLSLARTPVADLTPLKGQPLQSLNLAGATVQSLAPLAGMPLESLDAGNMRITDLSVLAGMPLRNLSINCGARDLGVLRGMPLEALTLGGASEVQDFGVLATLTNLNYLQMFSARIRDLSVLKDLPLQRLDLISCPQALDIGPLRALTRLKTLNIGQVAERKDIAALAGLDLEILSIDRTGVTDLSPLKGMKLKSLSACSYQPIHDYSVLEGMPLEFLNVGWLPFRWEASLCVVPDTLGFLKDVKTLKTLRFGLGPGGLNAYEQVLTVGAALRAANPNYKSGAFYRLKDGQITEVWLSKCAIGDLSPLKGLKLTRFASDGTPITDLMPLAGMPLGSLIIRDTPVADLTPLRDAPLGELDLTGSKVTDPAQLKGFKLQRLWIDDKDPDFGLKVRREVPTLTHINDIEVGMLGPQTSAETETKPGTDRTGKPAPAVAVDFLNSDSTRVLRENTPDTVSGFVGKGSGLPERQKTTAILKWNADGLEVVFDCTDSSIAAVFTEHDAVKMWKDDCVSLWLDTNHTHSAEGRGVMVQLSASGAVHDAKDQDRKFEVAGLKTEAKRTATGWQGTMRIPWAGLGVGEPKPGDVWGFNLTRNDQVEGYDEKKADYTSWVKTGNDNQIDRWGHLVFAAAGAKDDDPVITRAQQAIDATHQKRRQAVVGESQKP
jgi:Leucine-rich repeat (LRR) protein